MAKKKTETETIAAAPSLPSGPGVHATAVPPLPDSPMAVVVLHCLDMGDVELKVNGQAITFNDGIILRWGRRHG